MDEEDWLNHTPHTHDVWRFVNTFKRSAFHAHQLQFVAEQCVQSYQLSRDDEVFSRETRKINNRTSPDSSAFPG